MKLISCHIENFGKFHREDITFDGRLTAFCEGNGYGKSTLSAFLKAMFYGMKADRANSSEFTDRRHFLPFEGGDNYGGYVEFSSEGATYKIERYFEGKSGDSFTLYRNGVPTGSGEEPGVQFFGIDRDSFERTAYLTGADITVGATGDIKTKLNNLAEGIGDDADLTDALARLEKKAKEYKKSKSGNDLISKETEKVNRLAADIENERRIEEGLTEKYRRENGLAEEIGAAEREIAEAQSENVAVTNWEQYDRMLGEAKAAEEEIAAIQEKYPRGLPLLPEIEEAREALHRGETIRAGMGHAFSEEDGEALAAFRDEFELGVPSAEGLRAAEAEVSAEADLKRKLSVPREETERERELKEKFRSAPSAETVDTVARTAEEYREAEQRYNALPDTVAGAVRANTGKKKPLFMGLAAVSVLLILAGIALACASAAAGAALLYAGIAVGAVGLLALILVGFFYLNKKTEAAGGGLAVNPEKEDMGRKKDALYAQLQAILLPYGYSFESGAAYAVKTFFDDAEAYSALLREARAREEERGAAEQELAALRKKLDAFFNRYGVVDETRSGALSRLRADVAEYASLEKRRETAEKNEASDRRKLEENAGDIGRFCEKYGFAAEGLEETLRAVEQDVRTAASAKKTRLERKEGAEKLRREKGLTERPQEGARDLAALNARLGELRNKQAQLSKEIGEDEFLAEKLSDHERDRDEANGKLKEYKKTYDLLTKTVEFLNAADSRLKEKYIKPVKDKFTGYSLALERALGEKITVDADFNVRFLSGGKERDEGHLSSGQRSVVALCFRLALIDNMYDKEKPFLILDDPFASLDEEHFNRAKALLSDLSGRMQIVYFTCHPSRAMK